MTLPENMGDPPEIPARGEAIAESHQIISDFGWSGSPVRSPRAAAVDEIGIPDERRQDLGFIARVFAQMGLPHSDPGDHVKTSERRNGIYRLKLTADEESHLPYGSIPRVLLAFVGTEAVRARSRRSTWERT